jgi:hypothetical protein
MALGMVMALAMATLPIGGSAVSKSPAMPEAIRIDVRATATMAATAAAMRLGNLDAWLFMSLLLELINAWVDRYG